MNWTPPVLLRYILLDHVGRLSLSQAAALSSGKCGLRRRSSVNVVNLVQLLHNVVHCLRLTTFDDAVRRFCKLAAHIADFCLANAFQLIV